MASAQPNNSNPIGNLLISPNQETTVEGKSQTLGEVIFRFYIMELEKGFQKFFFYLSHLDKDQHF